MTTKRRTLSGAPVAQSHSAAEPTQRISPRVREEEPPAPSAGVQGEKVRSVTSNTEPAAEVRVWRGSGCSVDAAQIEREIAALEEKLVQLRRQLESEAPQ